MKLQKLFAAGLAMIMACNASAHAIWIETSPVGNTGKRQEIKIFFGEYAEGERDTVKNWFSNLLDVQVILTEPDGEKKLLTCSPSSIYMEAGFIPGKPGVYTVSIAHTVKDVYGTSKIEYYAQATVEVNNGAAGKLLAASSLRLAFDAVGEKPQKGKPLPLKAFYENSPLAKGKVTVASPAGWTKSFTTDESGMLSFEPAWPGLYLAQAFYTDKTPGTHNGKEYKSIMHVLTYGIYVNE